jgi:outer membrane receptor protein involved in Fe transport
VQVTPELRSEADAFTYLVTPRFRISPNLMMYGRFASGYRTGGPNSPLPPSSPLYDPAVPAQSDPDETNNYEFGVKGSVFDHALSFDASLYYIDWKDIQINVVSQVNARGYSTNGGNAKTQGAELAVEAAPLPGLTLGAWAVWSDAVLTESFPVTSPVSGASGDRLPYSSEWAGNFSVDQRFPLTAELTASVGGTVSYIGDRLGSFTGGTNQRETYPSFTKVDLRAGLEYGRLRINAYVANVSDERGVLGGGVGTFPPYAFVYIQPRTIGINLSADF